MDLDPVSTKFVLHWGEMGSRWGVSRTVSQIHGLLFLADRPLNAEEIADTLGIARSNVSTSLKDLQSRGLAQIVHIIGDRRDHFTTMKDVFEFFSAVVDDRKRREIDPMLTVLRECVAQSDAKTPAAVKTQITATLEFLEIATSWYSKMRELPPKALLTLMKMGNKVQSMLRKVA
jgi:DNA-binding transcriptional regulator GbsR (MarR family)